MKIRNRANSVRFMAVLGALGCIAAFGCSDSGNSDGSSGAAGRTVGGGGATAMPSGGTVAAGALPSAGAISGLAGSAAGAGAGGNAPLAGASQTTSGGGGSAVVGGSTAAGAPAGGVAGAGGSLGGSALGGNAPAGRNGGGAAGIAGGGSGGAPSAGSPAVGVTKDGETRLTSAGLSLVSYGGYLNGESFQQDGILSFNGYQYAAFWNTNRRVVLARRALPNGAWSTLEFTDYTNTANDAHNTISLGVAPGDGTLHVSFDHHVSPLHYRKSVAGLLTNPATATWATSSFSAVTSSLVSGTPISSLTYPRFVTVPGGSKLLFGARIGTSGSGDEYLWEYDATTHAWTSLGRYLNGTIDNVNGYPHGLSYTPGGSRLHITWCWRDTSNASTNHDLLYAYSDDHGRTWKNNVGATVATTGSSFLTLSSAGIRVQAIGQNRGLINQEHMAVDSLGRVHVLLSHMPDAQANDAAFESARTKSQFFHYWRNATGTWTRTALGQPVVAAFRGKLAISSSHNLYAVLPDLRIAAASAASNFATWSLLNTTDSGRFFSDPLIDTARLLGEDKLTVVYPVKSSTNIEVLDYTIR